MKRAFVFLLTLVAVCLLDFGCATDQGALTARDWKNRVGDWVPLGISVNDAHQALADNGFRWVGDSSVATATLQRGDTQVDVVMGFANGKLISQTTSVTSAPHL